MNDIAVARSLTLDLARNADRKKLRLRLAYAAGLVISWYTHVKSLEGDVEGAWTAFAATPPCWTESPFWADPGVNRAEHGWTRDKNVPEEIDNNG